MNISFGRAIKVKTSTYFDRITYSQYKDKPEPPIQAIVDTINGKSSLYGSKTQNKLREFLGRNISDYSEKSGLEVVKIRHENYFLTGRDAIMARDYKEKRSKGLEIVNNNFKKICEDAGVTDESKIKDYQSILRRNIDLCYKNNIMYLVKNGLGKKPEINLDLNISYYHKGGTAKCTTISKNLFNRTSITEDEINF